MLQYSRDGENQLIQVDGTLGTCSSAAACYVYDADGHRVERIVAATTIDYLYDLDGRVMVEVNSGPTVVADYVYAGGQLIAQYKNSTTYFVHDNNLGSSTILTSVAGAVVDCNALYPFGEQDNSICSSSATTTHKFTGKERDPESNLDNFGARYYSSAQGRFLTADWSAIPAPVPYADLHDPQTLNLYAYVGNNPLGKVDPDGHEAAATASDKQEGNVQTADISTTKTAVDGKKQEKTKTIILGGKTVHYKPLKPVISNTGKKGTQMEAEPDNCGNCRWTSTTSRTGEQSHAPETDRESGLGPQPRYPTTERSNEFSDTPGSSGAGTFTAVTTLGVADKGSKTFAVIGSMTWGYSLDQGGNVTTAGPRVSTPAEQAQSIAALKRDSPTWTIRP